MTRFVVSTQSQVKGDWEERGVIPAKSPEDAISIYRRYTGTSEDTPCKARKHVVTRK